jgi:uncharacterized protein (TIGR02996 family)
VTDLERALVEDPDDVGRFEVYGDWLLSQGDPRGELVAVQAALARGDRRRAHREREAALLGEHAKLWTGGLAGLDGVSLLWRLGFVDTVVLEDNFDRLPALFTAPAGGLVRTMHHRAPERDYAHRNDGPYHHYPDAFAALVAARPPALRELVADFDWPYDIDLGRPGQPLGDLGPLWQTFPRLEKVVLRAHTMTLGAQIDAPRLRHLEIHTPYGLDDEDDQSLAEASMPALETLILDRCWMARPQLRRFLDGVGLPALRHLTLVEMRRESWDELWPERQAWQVVPQLETLQVSGVNVDKEAVRAEAATCPHLRHLKRFTV